MKDFATTFRQNNSVQLGLKATSTTEFILLFLALFMFFL